jgi:NADH:ubiquinone oxidoreductase subunit 2 (subunit N)
MVSMWLADPDSSTNAIALSLPARVVLVVSVAVTLVVGVLPSVVLDLTDSLTTLVR